MKSILRITLFMFVASFLTTTIYAQDKSKRASPPMKAEASVGDANVVVTYSAPSVKGRTIWGNLVPYGKVWRAGANEATTIETDKDLEIDGKKLSAGKYSFFVIATESDWTFIFNSVSDQWGAYQYDEAKDVIRVSLTPTKTAEKAEQLTFSVDDGKLSLHWDNMMGGVAMK